MSSRAEAADVALVVDVARRRADQDERAEALRLARRGQHADHRAHRVADEDHVGELELAADLEHVVGVAVERGVALRVVGRQVRAAGADVVEEHDAVVGLERRAPRSATCSDRSRSRARTPSAGRPRCPDDADVVAGEHVSSAVSLRTVPGGYASTMAGVDEDVVAWRRHLHRHPELSFEEHETSAFVAETLEGFGLRGRAPDRDQRGRAAGTRPARPDGRAARRHRRAADPRGERRRVRLRAAGRDARLRARRAHRDAARRGARAARGARRCPAARSGSSSSTPRSSRPAARATSSRRA